jgi:uroporphyrin-III C-methyltransferase
VGKRSGRLSTAQNFINKQLLDAARRYRTVVRLKGGDPMLFGRAQEEIAELESHGIAYEVVPGVTAALAACAGIGTSLTQRGRVRSVALVTPRVGEGEARADGWVKALAAGDAGAIYMGAGEAPAIASALIAAGKPASLPVAIVESASLPGARTIYTTLQALSSGPGLCLDGPAMLLAGPQFTARGQHEVRCADCSHARATAVDSHPRAVSA